MVTFVCMFEPAAVLEELNDEQRRAATHDGGPLLVLAGAGTGKTGTLVARAAWLRSQGIQASRILLLTFTRRAADDMLARVASLAERIGAEDAGGDRICGGTFHAVEPRPWRSDIEHPAEFCRAAAVARASAFDGTLSPLPQRVEELWLARCSAQHRLDGAPW